MEPDGAREGDPATHAPANLTLTERVAIARFEFMMMANHFMRTRYEIQLRRGTHGHRRERS